MPFQASGTTLSGYQEEIAQSFSNQAMRQSEFSIGARPPINGSVDEWVSQAQINPMPLWYTLIPLHELLTPQYFPQDQNIGIKQKNLITAMYNYCPILLEEGAVKSCSAPTPNNFSYYTTVLNFYPSIADDGYYTPFGMYTLPGLNSQWNNMEGQTLTITGDYLPVAPIGQYPISYIILYNDNFNFDRFVLNLDTTNDPVLIVNISAQNTVGNQISCTTGQVTINSTPATITCNWYNNGNSLTIVVSVSEISLE